MSSQFLVQFYADPFEKLHVLLGWLEDTHVMFKKPEIIFLTFLHF